MNFKSRPEWERCTIVPPPTNTCHIKKTIVVCCMTKTLYGVLTHSFLIHSFSAISITLFTTALLKSLSAYIQLYTYFCPFIKSHLVFHVPVNCFAPSIFYSSYTNGQIGIVEHFPFANHFMEKSIYIMYILHIFV